MMFRAQALTSAKYIPKKNIFTGITESYEHRVAFRIELIINGQKSFVSMKEYDSYDKARRAAKRLENKLNVCKC